VAPYYAIGLSTVVYGTSRRGHIARNLETIVDGIHAMISMVNINLPVKLVALAEGALTGFTDEAFDVPHRVAARDFYIDIPGEETRVLGDVARLYRTYIIVQCKARYRRATSPRTRVSSPG